MKQVKRLLAIPLIYLWIVVAATAGLTWGWFGLLFGLAMLGFFYWLTDQP